MRPFVKNLDEVQFDTFREPMDELQTLSRVRIKIQTNTATKITRSSKVTFSSQVANLGKLLCMLCTVHIHKLYSYFHCDRRSLEFVSCSCCSCSGDTL